jgi:cytoskeletal protein RodZ
MIGRRSQPSTPVVDKPKGFDDFQVRLGDVMRGERATLGRSLLDVQRELKIKATYIAAIENCDVSAFESQGFIAGYIRSYARYLGLDPEWAYAEFCAEAGFATSHGMATAASTPRAQRTIASAAMNRSALKDPFSDPNATFIPRAESLLSRIQPGAVGSMLVLVALIGAIGYGGWSVLQEVQRVQLAPVDQAPVVVAEIDPLGNVSQEAPQIRSAPASTAVADADEDPVLAGAQGYDRLYRPQALDVPVIVARDGPIAGIDPRTGDAPGRDAEVALSADFGQGPTPQDGLVQVVEAVAPTVELLAVRPSWVRVQSADGTVLFEKILDAGERYTVPQMEAPAVLRAGNSGSVYFAVNGQTYGPAAAGAQVVKNVALSPEALTASYQLADLSVDPDLAAIVAMAEPAAEATAGASLLPIPD